MTPEQRLEKLGLTLPKPITPVANYVPFRFAGSLLYLSGQGPKQVDGTYSVGRLGLTADVEKGYADVRATGLQLLAGRHTSVARFTPSRSRTRWLLSSAVSYGPACTRPKRPDTSARTEKSRRVSATIGGPACATGPLP